MTEAAIETVNLGRSFGEFVAVDGISLEVPKGSIYGFLGPNGAGKSTTIRMLLGLIRPTTGQVRIFGDTVRQNQFSHFRSVGALVEAPSLYPHLSGRENLQITAILTDSAAGKIDRALSIVGLTSAADQLISGYSQGMRQRLGLALALLNDPDLLILDEPTNGLDPAGIQRMRELIRSLPGEFGVTVFMSSHLLVEVQQVASHLGILHQGQLIFQGRLEDLMANQKEEVFVEVDDLAAALHILVTAGLEARKQGRHELVIPLFAGVDAAAINSLLVRGGIQVNKIIHEPWSLESIFMQLTGQPGSRKGE
ncbi:MAG: ABC transporter ATP-binding protein [Anaerolineales bacterium]